ncbi:MAG: CPBP family intramembrane metalloprotease [Anaerolineae bacterium]|jgi:membrane protease YdiL (CAAX protease family)
MKHKSLVAFLVLVSSLSLGYVGLLKLAGQAGQYLAQGYMLIPALSAVITRYFFDERRFSDANLRLGRATDYVRFWLVSLGITVLYFASYTVLGAGEWDLSGETFLANLSEQLAGTGQDITEGLPPGLTPQIMLLIYFVGGLTVFNVLPGIITGLGEEFGWRGLMFPRLYEIRPWMAFVVGGISWFAWHLPLAWVVSVPQHLQQSRTEQLALILPMALGAVATHTYFAYVFFKTRNILVASLAHIVLNNASASFGYVFVIENAFLANLGTVLVMILTVVGLYVTGRFQVFDRVAPNEGGSQEGL